jgi:hypothetical protein
MPHIWTKELSSNLHCEDAADEQKACVPNAEFARFYMLFLTVLRLVELYGATYAGNLSAASVAFWRGAS